MPHYYFHLGIDADEQDNGEEVPALDVRPETVTLIARLDDEFVRVLHQCIEPVAAHRANGSI